MEHKTAGDNYYQIIVRPKKEFVRIRALEVVKKGRIQRLAGKSNSGSWLTHAWLIIKDDIHRKGNSLIPNTSEAKEILTTLGVMPRHLKADIFYCF